MGLKRILGVFLLLFLPAGGCYSCDVPVFKYALEFWEADPYDIYIFHKGMLGAEDEKSVTRLKDAARFDYRDININLNVRLVDLSGDVASQELNLWEEQDTEDVPWAALYYPFIHGIRESVWAGRLRDLDVALLLHSPKRSRIAQRLLDGESAVWVLLESGNRRRDNEVAELLDKELKRLERTLRLPDTQAWGWAGSGDEITAAGDEEKSPIRFSVLRVSRNEKDEQLLVRMLLNSEDDLKSFTSEPMVFPIYGRGLILYALVGRGINEWTINEAGEFLTGPCSCIVKASNPGVDMLLRVNWDKRTAFDSGESTPPLTGISEFIARAERAEELATIDIEETKHGVDGPDESVMAENEGQAAGLAERQLAEDAPLLEKDDNRQNSGNMPGFLILMAAALIAIGGISSFCIYKRR